MSDFVLTMIIVLGIIMFLLIYAMCKIASRDDAERERMANKEKENTDVADGGQSRQNGEKLSDNNQL